MALPKVSIIVPVYNVEQFLRRCLDSILAQTFTNWECILVDDGSTDGSGMICDEYAKKDFRFAVIHKINGGVSAARNEGIGTAKGAWLAFVDADDYLAIDYLQEMSNSSADLAICGFCSSSGFDFCPKARLLNVIELSIEMDAIMSSMALQAPWAKLFRLSIINSHKLRFDTRLKLHEDTMFVYDYLCYCRTVDFFDNRNYFYDGVWGGGKKYSLSWNDVRYMYDCRNERIVKLMKSFSCNLSKEKYVLPALSHIKNLCKFYKDRDCYNLFSQYHPRISEEAYFKSGMFIWDSLFRDVKFYYQQGQGDEYLKDLRSFITVPFSWVKPQGKKNAIIAFLVYYRILFPIKIYGRVFF